MALTISRKRGCLGLPPSSRYREPINPHLYPRFVDGRVVARTSSTGIALERERGGFAETCLGGPGGGGEGEARFTAFGCGHAVLSLFAQARFPVSFRPPRHPQPRNRRGLRIVLAG